MKQYLLTLFCLCVSMIALAQQKTITGTVIDTRHEPVIGASVLEKGTSNGTITNLDGEYSLKVSPGATLVFSYIGYKTQEIRVSANTNINVTLAEDAEQLQEVVVVGYGVQKKSSLTGSVASVSSKGEFYQFNLSSCIRQQNSLTAQFVSFSLSNLANIFYPPNFYNN